MKWFRCTAAVLAVGWLGKCAPNIASARPQPERAGNVRADGEVLTLLGPLSKMIRFNAGTFRMGSSGDDIIAALALCSTEVWGHRCRASDFQHEGPARNVTLSEFWFDRHEVTVSEYERCVTARRCSPIPYAEGALRYHQPHYPASMLTWEQAQTYCAFRDARLPTEAQFERVARGPAGRTYPWGNAYHSKVSNHGRFGWIRFDASDGYEELAAVGSFSDGATPQGVLDVAGNVAEWVADRYLPLYDPKDQTDPQGPPPGTGSNQRVVRGGSFQSAPVWLRGAARDFEEATARRPSVGFRCARSSG